MSSVASLPRSVGTSSPPVRASVDASRVAAGDLVFRRGRSLASQAVLSADPASAFSHVGIALPSEQEWLIVHALPRPNDAGVSHLVVEPLAAFLSTEEAEAFSVYRLRDEAARLGPPAAAAAYQLATDGVQFDAEFDLATDERMYCTELVWKAYLRVGVDISEGKRDELSVPFIAGAFILPSRLQRSSLLTEVQTSGGRA